MHGPFKMVHPVSLLCKQHQLNTPAALSAFSLKHQEGTATVVLANGPSDAEEGSLAGAAEEGSTECT